jgi:hypothetical protein
MEFGSVGGHGVAVAPFAHGPEEPPPVPPVPPVPPGGAPPVTMPPVPACAGLPPFPVPAVEEEPLTPPAAGAVPAVAGVVPAAAFAVPPVVLLPPKPVPALEVEPAKPMSPGSVAFEQATTKIAATPNQKPVVIQSLGLLCIVVDFRGAWQSPPDGSGESTKRSSTAMKAALAVGDGSSGRRNERGPSPTHASSNRD